MLNTGNGNADWFGLVKQWPTCSFPVYQADPPGRFIDIYLLPMASHRPGRDPVSNLLPGSVY